MATASRDYVPTARRMIANPTAEEQRQYTLDELYAAGMTKIEAKTCTVCHMKDSPTFSGEFDFEKRKDEGTHKHTEMPKLRKE